jgi:hypothetical protein
MSAPTAESGPAPAPAPEGAPAPPAFDDTTWDRARRWRPTGRGLAIAALLLLALVVLMLTTSRRTGYLDPAAVDPQGSRAVANVLADQGVRVTDVRTTADDVPSAAASRSPASFDAPYTDRGPTTSHSWYGRSSVPSKT